MSVLKRGVCVCVHDVQVRKTERLVACVCVCIRWGEVLVCMRLRVICVCVWVRCKRDVCLCERKRVRRVKMRRIRRDMFM